jgi:hypothetical protein
MALCVGTVCLIKRLVSVHRRSTYLSMWFVETCMSHAQNSKIMPTDHFNFCLEVIEACQRCSSLLMTQDQLRVAFVPLRVL